jgi:hypothetical protein
MDNVTQYSVINQLFSLLPFHLDTRCVFDRYTKKLTIAKSIALFTVALLDKWSSYSMMETKLRANEYLQEALALQEISGSQLSRKLNDIPTEFLQTLFLRLVADLNKQTVGDNGISKNIGKLGIVDSTSLHLPFSIGDWARLSSHDTSVKMHLRLIVASPETVYPDHMIPTTRNYDDREIALEMVTELDVTYVMDRGYVKYATMDTWVQNKTQFVMRINNTHITKIVEEREMLPGERIRRDAVVRLGKGYNKMEENVRLIEFEDATGRFYRVVTTRYDLSAEEIADIYRHRWLIELYFKWMKQHLRLVKLFSYKPQAVWNQMFMALIGYLMVLKLKKSINNTTKTPWNILQKLSAHLGKTWASFMAEVERQPTRKSKGRQRTLGPRPTELLPEGIGRIKLQGERKARKPRRVKKK